MIKRYKTGPRMAQAVAAGGTLYLAGQVADEGVDREDLGRGLDLERERRLDGQAVADEAPAGQPADLDPVAADYEAA